MYKIQIIQINYPYTNTNTNLKELDLKHFLYEKNMKKQMKT